MAQTTQTFTDYRNRLDAAVTAFSLFIRDLCPEAQLEISFARYEDEDAHIWASLPPTLSAEEQENLANRMAEKSLDLLLAEGFLIPSRHRGTLAGLECLQLALEAWPRGILAQRATPDMSAIQPTASWPTGHRSAGDNETPAGIPG